MTVGYKKGPNEVLPQLTRIEDPVDIYRSLGVEPAITASGNTTAFGGSKLRPEIMDVMNKASGVMVNLADLNKQAGKILADLTGAEAGLVTGGASAGLTLQAAACIAGNDSSKMSRLPDVQDLNNEIIIQKSQRFPYDQCYRIAGAKLVEIGDGRRCHPWQLEAAFTYKTAAVAYLQAPFYSRLALPLEQVCEIAHRHGVPVIVDAASMLPPRGNLSRYSQLGADMVIYSGGKGVRGPQGTGILCGKAELIEAASANSSPNQFLGRPMKVAKEEIVGLIAALQIFTQEDESAETKCYLEMSQHISESLTPAAGLKVTIEHDQYNYLIPTTVLTFGSEYEGPSRDAILERMATGKPPIFLHFIGNPNELAIDPINLNGEEVEIIIRRLNQEFKK